MRISFIDNRFVAYSNFDEKDALREAGFKWDKDIRRWTTTSSHVAETFIGFCDEHAEYQIKQRKKLNKEQIEKSAKVAGTTKLLHPEDVAPYPFQVAGVEYIAPRQACLLGDEMGTGKTIMALLTVNLRRCNVLIVCPKIVKYNWLKEIRKWAIGRVLVYVYEPKKIRYYKKRITQHDKDTIIHVINYDLLKKFYPYLIKQPYNFLISDESHLLKNSKTNRYKLVRSLAEKTSYRLFITGTPIYNRPKDLFAILNMIDDKLFGSYWQFAERYCGAKRVNRGGRNTIKADGATNMEELSQILRANYMVRRLKKDVLHDLPEKVRDVIIIEEKELEGLVAKENEAAIRHQQMKKEAAAKMEVLKSQKAAGAIFEEAYKEQIKQLRNLSIGSLGELSRIRHELADKKVPYVAKFVKDILDGSDDPNSKVIVFGYHKSVIYALQEKLKEYNPVAITGETPEKERQANIHAFQETDQSRVFLGNMGATGVGITLTAANTVVFAELDWTPANVQQSEDRAHRAGQTDTVWVYHLVADKSLDCKIAKMLVDKTAIADEILNYNQEQLIEKAINTEEEMFA